MSNNTSENNLVLSKLKHNLRNLKQRPDETHEMYFQKFAKAEALVKQETEKENIRLKILEMTQERKYRNHLKRKKFLFIISFIFSTLSIIISAIQIYKHFGQ